MTQRISYQEVNKGLPDGMMKTEFYLKKSSIDLKLLEQLSPKERAVFILKEGFGYSHQEISEVLSGTVELSRKLLSRAKSKLSQSKHPVKLHREPVPSEILEKYVNTIRGGDTNRLEDLLIYVYNKFETTASIIASTVNHQPALLFYLDTKLISCQVLGISPTTGEIYQISTVVDPDKLKNIEEETRGKGKQI